MGFWSAITSPFKAVTKGLFGGGGTSQTNKINVAPRSFEEQELLNNLISSAGRGQGLSFQVELSDQDRQIQNLFRTQLTNFLSGGNPEAVKQAAAFVDQTFTQPAEQVLNQSINDFANLQGARAAAMGRSPMDSAFQQQLFGNIANQRAQLGMQRGQLIYDQPLRQLQGGLQGLGGVSQIQQQNAFAPTFLNNLQQQAFTNRAALLNHLSGERFKAAGSTASTSGADAGILGNLAQTGAGVGQFVDFAKGGFGLGGLF